MISEHQKKIILEKLRPYQPKRVDVFGSYARGDNTSQSDLDILVDFGVRINLLQFIGIEQELSDQLGVKVDLITYQSLSPIIKPYIVQDIKPLLVNEE